MPTHKTSIVNGTSTIVMVIALAALSGACLPGSATDRVSRNPSEHSHEIVWEDGGYWRCRTETMFARSDSQGTGIADLRVYQNDEGGVAVQPVNGARFAAGGSDVLMLAPGRRFEVLTREGEVFRYEVVQIVNQTPTTKKVTTTLRVTTATPP